MQSVRIDTIRWCLLVLLALATALGALVEPAEAARPPVGRVYYTVAMGLETGYDTKTQCFEFHRDKLCTLDGLICGSWAPTEGIHREMGLSFDLTTLAGGDLMALEGLGRLDTRGPKSALAGTGRFSPVDGEDSEANFSFAAREVTRAECLDLLEEAPGGGDGAHVDGSGNLVTEERPVSEFHGLVATGVGRIEIRRGATESLRITADDNILPILTSEVRNGRLHLGSDGTFTSHDGPRYEITVRDLDELTLAGVMAVEATGIDTELFKVNISGVSVATVSGRADRQKVTVAGVSRYDARDLVSRTVDVDVTGPSSAVVRASGALRGSAIGGATIEYIGNPTINVKVDLLSKLRKIG